MRRRWLVLTVVLVLWGLATHGTHAGSGDEPHYLAIAHSIAGDLDLDLLNNYGAAEPLLGGGNLDPENHTRPGVDGALRPLHDVGLPLLFSPFARIGVPVVSTISSSLSSETMRRFKLQPPTLYKHFVSAVMIVTAAALALVLLDVMTTVASTRMSAFRWTLLIVLSSPLLVISISFFTEVISALLCLVVFRRLITDPQDSMARWCLAGALTGLLLLVHARNAGLAAGLVVFAILRLGSQRRLRDLAYFLGGMTALVAVRTALNHHFWGTWLTSPHARAGEWSGTGAFLAEIGRRAAGMLIDQEFGLLPYAPIFLLAPYGLVLLARMHRRLFTGIALVAGGYLVLVVLPLTNAHGWTGGWSPTARFWVPVVPLLAVAVAAAAQRTPAAVLIPLVIVQIGINAYLWQNPKSAWNDGDGTAAVCARSGRDFCRYLPSFVIEQERQRPTQ